MCSVPEQDDTDKTETGGLLHGCPVRKANLDLSGLPLAMFKHTFQLWTAKPTHSSFIPSEEI